MGEEKLNIWKNKRVLVTGATGLVGSWLVRRLLSEGAFVTALILDHDPASGLIRSGDINQISVVNGNLADFSAVMRAVINMESEVIFHLGAQTIVGTALLDPMNTFSSNIQGTWNVLEAARQSKGLVKSVMVASSDKAYGTSKILPYDETMPLNGLGPYDVSKSCTDLIAQTYGKTYEIPVVIARCGNIYGGGDLNWSRVVPGTIRSILKGERPIIRSNGKFVRDYIYVKDAAQAYLRLAEHLVDGAVQGQGFNFSVGKPMTVLEIVGVIQKLMHAEHLEPIIQNTAKGEILSQYLSSEKAERLLKWKPSCGLEKGLEETISWYREFLG